MVRAALDWIDDPVGLYADTPVRVADLWREVMVAATGGWCESVTVVHPPDWPAARVDRVLAAANCVADRVTAVPSDQWTAPGDRAPVPAPRSRARWRPGWPLPPVAVIAILLAGLAVMPARPRAVEPEPAVPPSVFLVEGRLAVRVPPDWSVERILAGPGSRRVQVSVPADPGVALQITQAYAPEATLADTAEMLQRAISDQPDGVFADFRPVDAIAGRPAVTYREVRPGRTIRWAVLAAGAIRVAIGCQAPPGRESAIGPACEEAARSARDVGTETGR